MSDRTGEHYGLYGPVCINTGQFDAGVCWKCQIKALKAEDKRFKQEYEANMHNLLDRIEELERQKKKAWDSYWKADRLAQARLDAVAKCTRYSLSNDTPTGVDFDPEGDLLSVEEVWAALEQKDVK